MAYPYDLSSIEEWLHIWGHVSKKSSLLHFFMHGVMPSLDDCKFSWEVQYELMRSIPDIGYFSWPCVTILRQHMGTNGFYKNDCTLDHQCLAHFCTWLCPKIQTFLRRWSMCDYTTVHIKCTGVVYIGMLLSKASVPLGCDAIRIDVRFIWYSTLFQIRRHQ